MGPMQGDIESKAVRKSNGREKVLYIKAKSKALVKVPTLAL